MKLEKFYLSTFVLALATATILFSSCRAKKLVTVQQETVEVTKEEKPASIAAVEEKAEELPVTAPEKMPDFNYRNIQFEFNSAVLKTTSYATLDQIAMEMKKYPSLKFNINGHSSQEGTEQRNQTLSVDRANSVKAYLVNEGMAETNLSSVGFGESKPIASNETEKGRALNRRVEIKRID